MKLKKTTRLKNLIVNKPILKMPCAHDALSAMIAEKIGFKAVCVGGYGVSACLLGKPDIGLTSMTETVDHVRRIADCVDIPVFVDADTGYGNTLNVQRTIRYLERAGAAGVFIEDQASPKRCGHMEGKEVIPVEEILAKIRAAVDSRIDQDFIIMGRTDALAVNGLDDALNRGNRMIEAGADIIFVEAPQTIGDMEKINRIIEGPTFIVYLEGGKIPLSPPGEFEKLGYNVVAYAASGLYAAAYAIQKTFQEIMDTGETRTMVHQMIQFDDFNSLLGLPQIRAMEKKYSGNR